MAYIAKILEPGEAIQHRARIHWFIYLRALWMLLQGTAFYFAGLYIRPLMKPLESYLIESADPQVFDLLGVIFVYVAYISWAIGVFGLLLNFIERRTTEIAVTDRRVIVKTGWIGRDTSEINRQKVEGVRVDQSVMGRVFGFGTIEVQGTGGGIAPIKGVDDPIDFRNAVAVGPRPDAA